MSRYKKPMIYETATAHLDTVWNWDLDQTVKEFLLNTLEENFRLFGSYPEYCFNFEGATRYQLIEEFYPELFQKLASYIADGRWFLAGSAWENGDVIVPSVEALMRNYLYGNRFFKQEFGKETKDIFLPDCFGFPQSLPSMAGHMGLNAFSTAKLIWNPGNYLPFTVGIWVGPDGSQVIATLDPGQYMSKVNTVISRDESLYESLDSLKVPKLMRYYGVGDMGGAPDETSVQNIVASIRDKDAKVDVVAGYAGQIADEMSQEERRLLPTYSGGLLMSTHGVGTYTSFGILKRLNRRNETLADVCERLNVLSDWLGYKEYPKSALETAWKRVINHQFHDDITGTSTHKVYRESVNDLVISLNQFEHELSTAAECITEHIRTDGMAGSLPVVVFNMSAKERTDIAQVHLNVRSELDAFQVYDASGREVLTQVAERNGDRVTLLFPVHIPSFGYAVYYTALCDRAQTREKDVYADKNTLINQKYRVTINESGDISSIFDKMNGRELLKDPISLQLFENSHTDFGSWEILYKDIAKGPRESVCGKAKISVTESGPVRASLRIEREVGRSTFTQVVSLSSLSERVDVDAVVLWYEKASLLKAAFPFMFGNETAVCDGGIGTLSVPNANEHQYEFPVNRWIQLQDSRDDYSVTVMSDCKYGWDKPDNHTLRLSLIHTPLSKWSDEARQDLQDFGENRFSYAVIGNKGGWQERNPYIAAAFYNEPLVAVQTTGHSGALPSVSSFIRVSTDQIQIKAVKMAEDGQDIIIRMYEALGKAADKVVLEVGEGIQAAHEVNGYEERLSQAEILEGNLSFQTKPYQTKAFRLKLQGKVTSPQKTYCPIAIENNVCISSSNNHRGEYGIGDEKTTFPAELMPDSLVCGGVPFVLLKNADQTHGALLADNQTFKLPAGCTKVYLLACSTQGDRPAGMYLDKRRVVVHVQDMTERVGVWDQYAIGQRGHIKRDVIAYCSSHTHDVSGDHVCGRAYLFCYDISVGNGESLLTLPADNSVLITAITAAIGDDYRTTSASVLYDIK